MADLSICAHTNNFLHVANHYAELKQLISIHQTFSNPHAFRKTFIRINLLRHKEAGIHEMPAFINLGIPMA